MAFKPFNFKNSAFSDSERLGSTFELLGVLNTITVYGFKIQAKYSNYKLPECFFCEETSSRDYEIIRLRSKNKQLSKEINEKNLTKETSFSTNAIQERLALLKSYYNSDIGFVYEEVKEGTKVVLKIPFTR